MAPAEPAGDPAGRRGPSWRDIRALLIGQRPAVTGVDDPAPSRFVALDKDKIAREHNALGVFLNPPRYWMFDEFRVFEAGDDQELGGIKMTWMGVVDVATPQKGIIGGNYFPGTSTGTTPSPTTRAARSTCSTRPMAKSSSCSPATPTPTKAWRRDRVPPPSAAS